MRPLDLLAALPEPVAVAVAVALPAAALFSLLYGIAAWLIFVM
jgi:hypothetical protein